MDENDDRFTGAGDGRIDLKEHDDASSGRERRESNGGGDVGSQSSPGSDSDSGSKAGSTADRRRFLRTVGGGAAATVSLTAGCLGGGESGNGGGTGGGSSGTAEPAKEITVIQEEVPDTAIIEELLPRFEEETGIAVNFETFTYSAVQEKTFTQLRSGTSDFDVHIVDIYWLGDFATGGLIRTLDNRIANTDSVRQDLYVETLWNALATYEGSTYGIPYFNYMHGMMYRQDILEDSELGSRYEEETGNEFDKPQSVREYVDLCRFLTRDTDGNGEVDFYGASMTGKRGVPHRRRVAELLPGDGRDVHRTERDTPTRREPGRGCESP
jgi:ABC-type glycerol-3-phosphate transport system substrate-binding protein